MHQAVWKESAASARHPPLSPNEQTLSWPQFVREFAKLGLTRSVGGVLGLALARELTPVVTSIILAGKPHLGSASLSVPGQHLRLVIGSGLVRQGTRRPGLGNVCL